MSIQGSYFSNPFMNPYLTGAFPSGSNPLANNPFAAQMFGGSALDMFSMGNTSIPAAQMLPMLMGAIIQQQLALMFLAELLAGGGGRRQQGGGCNHGGGFPNGNFNSGRRLGPGAWNNNGVTGPGAGVIATPGAAAHNGTATIDSVRNSGARNQMVSGRITVNGRTYQYNSGGHGRGSLPPGQYQVTPHMFSRNTRGMVRDGVGYSFALNNAYDPRVGGTRTALRIHPDGGSAGTMGCIGIVGDAATQRQFRADMMAEIRRNGGSFTLNVGVPGNQVPNSPTNVANNGVTGPTSASAANLNRHLGGVFSGQGQAFIDAARRHGIDPNLLAAIAMHETGNGTSNAVRNHNNPGGLMNPRTNWSTLQRFGSLSQGIDAMARNLKRGYINQGLTSVAAIGRKYAPVGAGNDPRGLNRHWVPNVTDILRRIS